MLQGREIAVKLLPARYVRASVERPQTDATDAAVPLERRAVPITCQATSRGAINSASLTKAAANDWRRGFADIHVGPGLCNLTSDAGYTFEGHSSKTRASNRLPTCGRSP